MAAWLTVIIGWIVIFALLAGLGQWTRRLIKLPDYTWLGWLDSFWLGYAVSIAALQAIHLVMPIDWHITALLGVLGLVALIACFMRRSSVISPVISVPQNPNFKTILLYLCLLLPLIFWLANRALSPQLDFDSGFYHLSSIKWLNEYPIVPGLANLHYRLGFNQTIFLLDAVLNAYPYFDHGFTFVNSLLMLVLLAQLLWITVRGLFATKSQSVPIMIFVALLLPICLYRATPQRFSANLSSPSPDLSVFIFQILTTLMLLRYLFPTDSPRTESQRFAVLYLITICAVGVTSKLSFAVFGGAILLITVLHWLWQNRAAWQSAAGWLLRWSLVIGFSLGVVWIVRTSILTGYPLFPNRAAALPVDFRVPSSIAREAELWVYAFARDPRGDMDRTLSNWDWLGGWWWRMGDSFNQFLFVIPLYIALAALALLILAALSALIRHRPLDGRYPLLALPALLTCLAWFFSAPDPRFAGAAFWLLAATLALGLLTSFPRLSACVSIGITVYLFVLTISTDFTLRTDFPIIPQPPLQEFRTESGLVYNRSASTQNPLNLYNAPLPNSPYEHPRLTLRGSDLREGFRLPEQ